MFDDLAAYYHENVVTEFLQYRKTQKDGIAGRSRDLRHALTAATALFHLREHLPAPGLSRAQVERECPDYALLGDLVNAAKHKTVQKQTAHGSPLVSTADRIEECQLVIEYEDAEGTYRHVIKTVVVKLTDDTERDVLEVMTNVINFWESQLALMGVIRSARTFSFEDPRCARSRSECNHGHMNLEGIQGLRLAQRLQFFRFDPAVGKAGPVDVTGWTFKGSIYRPPSYELVISLQHKTTGRELSQVVVLNEKESLAVHRLASEEDRWNYAISTDSGQRAMRELALSAGLIPGVDAMNLGPGTE